MIKFLSIKNLLLIDEIDIDLNDGLCVLTGETGAGKSMILDSLSLISGERIKIFIPSRKWKSFKCYSINRYFKFSIFKKRNIKFRY